MSEHLHDTEEERQAHERQVGRVRLRGDRADGASTTDQRLLDSRGPSDWVHTDPWRVLRIQSEFVDGFGAMAELGPAVSVFGSARTAVDDPVYALAEEVGLEPVVRVGEGESAVPMMRNPIWFSRTPPSYRLPPPGHDEHGEEIRAWLSAPSGRTEREEGR